MNEANSRIDYYKSYFSGIKDIFESNSPKQTALGIVKILSGLTVIIPIYFVTKYLFAKVQLQSLKNLNDRVSKSLDSNSYVSKNLLIEFLSMKVMDKDPNRFEQAFMQLNDYGHRDPSEFFADMADKRLLSDALSLVPQNLKEIRIDFGYAPSSDMIDKSIQQLGNFKNLQSITFNIGKTTYLTKGIERLFEQTMSITKLHSYFNGVSADFDPQSDYAKNGAEGRINNYMPAYRILRALPSLLHKESRLEEIRFYFKAGFGDRLSESRVFNSAKRDKNRIECGSAKDKDYFFKEQDLDPPSENIWIAEVGKNHYSA